MKDDDILGFHRRLPPFRAKRMDWRHFPHLIQRKKMRPPELPALPQLEAVMPNRAVESIVQLEQGYIDPDM